MTDITEPSYPTEHSLGAPEDGTVLKPASQNPWYILMTIGGEIEGNPDSDDNLALLAMNRRFWNGWACTEINRSEREKLAEKLGLEPVDLNPLSKEEEGAIQNAFNDRLGHTEIPDPRADIDLSEIHFSKLVVLHKWIFCAKAIFEGANFNETVDFRDSIFTKVANFQNVAFPEYSDFQNATFSVSAYFREAIFIRHADFNGATFSGRTNFQRTEFFGYADFRDAAFLSVANFEHAKFGGTAKFIDGAFGARSTFEGARFATQVPEFYQSEFHQDNEFVAHTSYWPNIEAMDRGEAKDAKRAYTRLAQVMAELHKPDDEAFFRRQEMRCAARLADGPHRLLWRAYAAVSDYGYSVWRPLALLLLTVLMGFEVLAIGGCPLPFPGVAQTMSQCGWSAMGMSFGNTFGFLGFGRLYFGVDVFRELPGWLKVLGGAQTVLGVAFLFFLGFGLRNRFRLR